MNILDHPILLLPPARISSPFGWAGHIPFAMLLMELARPRLLVELGTHSGNSFNAFCQAVDFLELPTHCFAVDTWEGDPHAGAYGDGVFLSLQAHINSHYGRFVTLLKMTFDAAKSHFEDASIDILHIDGLHTYEAVRHDFENWLPKLSEQAVVLFHDTHVRQGDFGVWRLWDELKKDYPWIEFPHSNGLGVLFVGTSIPSLLRPLIDMAPSLWLRFQHLVERLGGGIGLDEQFAGKAEEIKGLVDQIHNVHLTYQAELQKLGEVVRACQERIGLLENRLQIATDEKGLLSQQYEQTRIDRDNLFAQIEALHNSTSWRVTRPLRSLAEMVSPKKPHRTTP